MASGRRAYSQKRSARHSAAFAGDNLPSAEPRIQQLLQKSNHSLTLVPRLRSQDDPAIERQTPAPESRAADHHCLTVLVADDHPVVREGLVSLINRQPAMRVVAEAGNGSEAVEQFMTKRPAVALVDLRMPVMDGIETVTAICAKDPTARLIMISTYESEEDIYRALRAGAQGYVLKDVSVAELVNCIHVVGDGRSWIPPQIGAKLAKRVTGQQLTTREMDVLVAVAAGKSNKEIGVAFNISEGTVKVHVTHILEKLRVCGRTEAINVAVKRGLVRLDGAVPS